MGGKRKEGENTEKETPYVLDPERQDRIGKLENRKIERAGNRIRVRMKRSRASKRELSGKRC